LFKVSLSLIKKCGPPWWCAVRSAAWLVVAIAATAAAQTLPPPLASENQFREDFSSASLASSSLQADLPELVERVEETGYISEWVKVQWRPGDPIYLYLTLPRNNPKPPVVIYLYEYPYETDVYRDSDWCERVTASGYAAAGFVPALTGHRYHDRPMKEWFVSELQESLASSAHDVQMVLNYLQSRGDLDMDRVGIFGAGAGATIALMAASVDSRIKVIDLLNPWGDWPVWMAHSKLIPEEERPNYVKAEFLSKVAAFDPIAVLPKLSKPRIRLIQTDDASGVTPLEAKAHMEAARPAAAESHHFQSEKEFENSMSTVGGELAWLKNQLRPQTRSAATGTGKATVSTSNR